MQSADFFFEAFQPAFDFFEFFDPTAEVFDFGFEAADLGRPRFSFDPPRSFRPFGPSRAAGASGPRRPGLRQQRQPRADAGAEDADAEQDGDELLLAQGHHRARIISAWSEQ